MRTYHLQYNNYGDLFDKATHNIYSISKTLSLLIDDLLIRLLYRQDQSLSKDVDDEKKEVYTKFATKTPIEKTLALVYHNILKHSQVWINHEL